MLWLLSLLSLLVYVAYRVACFWYARITSPIRYVPGPKTGNLLTGQLRELWKARPDASTLVSEWVEKYGPVMKHRMLLGRELMVITDLKALNHILQNSFDFQKPEPARWTLGRVIGQGLVVVEGEKHRQQRKIMNPAFGSAQIHEFTDLFIEKSIQLRDILQSQQQSQEKARVDILSWFSKTTLDVIGLAGFNYKFDSLNPSQKPNELNEAFSTMFRESREGQIYEFLRARYPILRKLPAITRQDVVMRDAKRIMLRIGKQLLDESKATLMGTGEKGENWRARDILSLLLRANMGSDVDENHRMSDSDVLAQIATFLAAGHETTSTGTTWAIYYLTQNPEAQTKLRQELLSFPTDNPTMDELNSLPYLDCVTRESLRILPPVPSSMRVAMKDSIIPLSEPYTDTLGVVHDHLVIPKGQAVSIPIAVINRSKALWGPDAHEFKPERWTAIPQAATAIPSVWSNISTFLSGPRACIGFRFAVIEMKALLFTLIRAFEFELAVPAEDIKRRIGIVQRPSLFSEPDGGSQMPVYIRFHSRKDM